MRTFLCIVILLLACAAPAGAALIARYNFEEGSGTTVFDKTGAYNGSLQNGASRVPGWIGTSAAHFDGVDDFISLGDNKNFFRGVSGATITGWIRIPAGVNGYRRIFSATTASSIHSPRVGIDLYDPAGLEGMLSVGATSADGAEGLRGTNTGANVVPDDTWTHFAAVFDFSGKTLALYVNGQQHSRITNVSWSSNTTTNLPSAATDIGWQGHGATAVPFIGDIDDFRIYNNALLPFQIAGTMPEPGATLGFLAFVIVFSHRTHARTHARAGAMIPPSRLPERR